MGDQDPEQRPECESVLGDYHNWCVNKERLKTSKHLTEVLEMLKNEDDDFLHNFLAKYIIGNFT